MQLRSISLITAIVATFVLPRVFAEQVFNVTGVVRAPLKEGRVVITHDDIPGFMPSMTMGFTVANSSEASALVVGDRVQFHLRVSETASTVADFSILGRAASPETPDAAPATRNRLREGDRMPSFSLLTQDGEKFTAGDLIGHITVATFIFSRCPVPEYCPAMAVRFAQLQKRILADATLARRARLLSITLDPEFDRPEILKAYGAAVGANPTIWQFATGEKPEIDALTKAFAVFAERNGVMLDHTLCTAVIDREGRVIEIWRGNSWKADELFTALTRAAAP